MLTRESKALSRKCTVRTIHTGIDIVVAGKFDQSVQIGVQRERRAGRERVKGRENDSKSKVI